MSRKTTFALDQCNLLSDCMYTIKSKQEIHTANNIYKWKIKPKISAKNHICLCMMIVLGIKIESTEIVTYSEHFQKT